MQYFLESISGMNGAPIAVLVIVGITAFAIAVPIRNLIHRFTPHPIDSSRFDHDEE